MDNYDVSVHGGDGHFVPLCGQPHSHQSGEVEELLMWLFLAVGVVALVNVPPEHGAVEARGDQGSLLGGVFNVLDPFGVTRELSDTFRQVPEVPEVHRAVVGAGGEGESVNKPETDGKK